MTEQVPIYIAVALFAVGVLLGLLFGPASERLENARLEGFLEGRKSMLGKEPQS